MVLSPWTSPSTRTYRYTETMSSEPRAVMREEHRPCSSEQGMRSRLGSTRERIKEKQVGWDRPGGAVSGEACR